MLLRTLNGNRLAWRLRDEMDRVFSNVVEGFGDEFPFSLAGTRTFPPVNVLDEGGYLVAEAELPGMGMDDLEVTVSHDELTLRGSRKEACVGERTVLRKESGDGTFSRTVSLPVAVDAEKVEATLKNGVLTIRMPKAQEVLPRKVVVKS